VYGPASSGRERMASTDLDVLELGRLVRQKRADEQLSLRQAAALARVSFSTLSRVEDGAQPDLSTFTSLCAWLGVNPGRQAMSPRSVRITEAARR